MTIVLYRIDELPQRLVGRWNELLAHSPVRSAFLSHAFCDAVQKVRGGVFVLHIESGNGGEGFLPFQIRAGRALLGHAEKVGGSMSDYFGIIGNLEGPLDPHELLRAAKLSSLRFDHAVPSLSPFAFTDGEVRRGVRLCASGFAQLQNALLSSNKHFIKSAQGRERRLEKEVGRIVFTWNAIDPIAALDRLVGAKRAQYWRTGVDDALADGWRRNLLAVLLRYPARESPTALISTLHAGSEWIASKFSLLCRDTLHSWFSVYDPHHRRHGPGHLLWLKVIEAGCSNGIRIFDFGEGEADYKALYGGEEYELWKGTLRRNTVLGYSERVMQSLQWKWGPFVNTRNKKTAREPSQASRALQ
jgi:CelD/BcsL family acetyltransferase involved in cellulose biosynthesis